MIVNARFGDPQLSARMSAALAARFREVIVDEAQDCNPADLEIINWLRRAGIVTKVICDPHQSIYEFRGGVTEQLFAFGQTFAAPTSFWALIAGIGMKSPAHIGVRNGLHRFADLDFQIFVRNDQRANGRPHVAAARRDSMIHGSLQPVPTLCVRLWTGGAKTF
jgi:hypothetical protein